MAKVHVGGSNQPGPIRGGWSTTEDIIRDCKDAVEVVFGLRGPTSVRTATGRLFRVNGPMYVNGLQER